MDERMRKFERGAASGDPEARFNLLREKIRSGELTEERLGAAAYLGDETAQKLLGDKWPLQYTEGANYPWHETSSINNWLKGLGQYDEEAVVRFVVEAARMAMTAWEKDNSGDDRPQNYLNSAEDALADFTSETYDKLRSALRNNYRAAEVLAIPAWNAARSARLAAYVAAMWLGWREKQQTHHSAGSRFYQQATEGVFQASLPHSWGEWPDSDDVESVRDIFDPVRPRVAQWALGEGDAIAERVKAREQSKE